MDPSEKAKGRPPTESVFERIDDAPERAAEIIMSAPGKCRYLEEANNRLKPA